jgi:V/A-type H+-transporting ATPase subunit I
VLRPVPMVHLRIQVGNRDAASVTRRIAAEGVLHLVDLAHGRVAAGVEPPGTRELAAGFRDLVRRIERLAQRLNAALPEPAGSLEARENGDLSGERQEIEARLAPIEKEIEEIWRRREDKKELGARARHASERIRRLQAADLDVGRLTALRFTDMRLGTADPDALTTIASLLSPAPFAIVPLEAEGGLAAIAVTAPDRERLDAALRVVSFTPVPVPADSTSFDHEMAERDARGAEERWRELSGSLEAARDRSLPEIAELWRRAQVGLLLLEAQTHFAAAGRFVVISGWVPAESAERLKRAILERTGGKAVVEIERPEDLPEVSSGALRVPILHRNPILLRPFQKLVQIYGTPSYREVQPTAFFAASFLAMFGLMFGDVGQGLVLCLAGYCLFRYIPRYLDYGILLMEGGVSATVFGFLYGSFFGIEGALPVLWMDPIRDLTSFLKLAISLGVFLVSAGLVLNAVNAWRAGERALALFGPRGLLGAFGYWVFAGLAVRALVGGKVRIPAAGILVLAAIPLALILLRRPIVRRLERGRTPRRATGEKGPFLLGALEGAVELVDAVVSYFANTISFLRVAAFAMVHAGAFLALFALADTLSRLRGGGTLSILLLVAGNVVMIFLEGLTVSVQVLRLEYYEFFGKFFRGGGEPYRPLMLRPRLAKGDTQ